MNNNNQKHGGNSTITFCDKTGTAKKILKQYSKEKIERFKREVDILMYIQKLRIVDNIIKIISADLNNIKQPSFVMKKYAGDSRDLLSLTKGNVIETVKLILPVAKTLKRLAVLSNPIYHRDLKPENLLYEKTGVEIKLILADFGCAIFKSGDEDRITNEFRAVGAMAYRAPEYHHGRVENINEKGDIFSIGKLLWYFVNGVESEVFPYTLWFPEGYNIISRFPNIALINKLNLIIALTTHHNPDKRLNYENLIASLEDILSSNNLKISENELELEKLHLAEFEAKEALRVEERREYINAFVSTVYNDILETFDVLKCSYQGVDIVNSMYNKFIKSSELYRSSKFVNSFIETAGSAWLAYVSLFGLICSCEINDRTIPFSEKKDITHNSVITLCVKIKSNSNSNSLEKQLYCFAEKEKGLQMIFCGIQFAYDKNKFLEILKWAVLERAK